jgi:tetratricopeptide (TPR) repeat protein
MPPNIVWTRRAEERLGRAPATSELPDIARRLAAAFSEANDVIVLDCYVGFKRRPGENILRIDVRKTGESNTYVVKLANHQRLKSEQAAWTQCGLTGSNPVFMPLTACPDPDHAGHLSAIAYQDAQKHIGAEETVWLETAIRRCVRFGSPSLDSILKVLHDIYAQAGRLHDSSRLVSVWNDGIETKPDRAQVNVRFWLGTSLSRWNEPRPDRIRRQVNAAFPVGFMQFFDPIDYYQFLDDEQRAVAPSTSVLPKVLRGMAHGDLHGRNSLVGIDDQEQACFPTLFDYESIYADNLIGWDFVEMETELKVRIYDSIFPAGSHAGRAVAVQQFEWKLAEASLHCHEAKSWSNRVTKADSPGERLHAILLAIRAEAFHTLGRARGESIDWLQEYLFLLGCYGLETVWYDNQTDNQRLAAYVSAGVASAFWEKVSGQRPHPLGDVAELLAGRFPTYQIVLAVARDWNRGENRDARERAARLLKGLVEKYPAALHVWFERAFNFTKLGRIPDSVKLLHEIHAAFGGRLDSDTFSLWGRCYKEQGDGHLDVGLGEKPDSAAQRSAFQEAEESYGHAIKHYINAYEVDRGFFPAINIATLTFLRAGLCTRLERSDDAHRLREEARQKAIDLGSTSSKWPELLPDDGIWKRATEAEAAMLCRNWDYAVERFRAALNQPQCSSHHSGSMGRQFRRILDGYRLMNEAVPLHKFAVLDQLQEYIQSKPETPSFPGDER